MRRPKVVRIVQPLKQNQTNGPSGSSANSGRQVCYIASLPVELLSLVFDEAVALEMDPLTLASVCLHWSRVVRSVPRYWSVLVIRDKFSTQRVKEALYMAKSHFETIKVYNLAAHDLIRLGKVLRRAAPVVGTLYYDTTECSSIQVLASLGLKPDSLIIRNEDPRGDPLCTDLEPLLGPNLRTLSLHRSSPFYHSKQYIPMLRPLTSLSITGTGFISMDLFYNTIAIEEIILDFIQKIEPSVSHSTLSNISLPSLRIFKLRHVPCPNHRGLPTFRIHAPKLHTFHLDSTSAAYWLLAFSDGGAPATIVDFRVHQPNGPVVTLSHIQPFLCDTIESFALTSVSHDLGPLLRDLHARRILPRRKYLEFTFDHD
jgi:hypothetical protein